MYPYKIETPHGLGPHEGIELDLMLTNKKPCSYFCDTNPGSGIIPEEVFKPFVTSGKIRRFETCFVPPDLPQPYINMIAVYFCLPGKEMHVGFLQSLHKENRAGKWKEENDITEGRLLGYDECDIKAYMHHWKKVKVAYKVL